MTSSSTEQTAGSGPGLWSEVQPLMSYYESIQREFQSRTAQVRSYTKDPVTLGQFREHFLRSLIKRHCPSLLSVGTGFAWTSAGQNSSQLDIVVYDTNTMAPCFCENNFVVVHADSVVATVEVLSSLNQQSLHRALENVRSIRQLNEHVMGLIFAYGGDSFERTVKRIEADTSQPIRLTEAPSIVCVLPGATNDSSGFVLFSPTHSYHTKKVYIDSEFKLSGGYCFGFETDKCEGMDGKDLGLAFFMGILLEHLEFYCQCTWRKTGFHQPRLSPRMRHIALGAERRFALNLPKQL